MKFHPDLAEMVEILEANRDESKQEGAAAAAVGGRPPGSALKWIQKQNVKNFPLHGSVDSKFMAHSRDIEAAAIKCKCQLHILICAPPAPPPAAGAEQKSTPNSFSPLETLRTPTIPY